jgi:hypothetical protein
MALLWIDGFEGYGTSGNVSGLTGRYFSTSQAQYAVITPGRIAGYAVGQTTTTAAISFTTPNLTTDPTMTVGTAFWINGTQYNAGITLYDNATAGVSVYVYPTAPNSTIVVKVGNTTVATYTDFLIALNTWYYLELKVFCHSSSGTIEVRLDGVTLGTLAGINTQTGVDAYYNRVTLGFYATAAFDDFYVCDGSGSSLNDFQGVCKVLGLFPNADTSTIQWTPSTGTTHYNLVDENPANGATDYVSTSTQANTDLYTYPSLVGTGTILGLQVNTTVALPSGTSAIIESPIYSNDVLELGPDTTITSTSYADVRHISTTDPNTGSAWTVTNLAAAKIGIRMM